MEPDLAAQKPGMGKWNKAEGKAYAKAEHEKAEKEPEKAGTSRMENTHGRSRNM